MDFFVIYVKPMITGRCICLFLFLFVSGCATMSKNECLNAQWQNVGYEDGAKGYNGSRIGIYRKACAEYNVSPDLQAYTLGRQQGLKQWCTPGNGYLQGTRGAVYNGICPKDLEPKFKRAMNHGRAVYNYRQKVQNQESMLAQLKKDLTATEQQISSMEAELISNQTQQLRRVVLLNEIRKSENDREVLRNDISEAESNLDAMHRRLNRLMARTTYN